MLSYIIKRIAIAVPLLLVILLSSFLLLYALPGDAVSTRLGKNYTQAQADQIRKQEGLDKPLYVQFARYIAQTCRGDFGINIHNQPVSAQLKKRLPATIELAGLAILIATLVGVTGGIISALKPRGWTDMGTLSLTLAGVSMPIFFLALLAQKAFKTTGWIPNLLGTQGLPLGGRLSNAITTANDKLQLQATLIDNAPLPITHFHLYDALFVFQDFPMLLDAINHLILPATVLATVPTAIILRITRTAMGQQLSQDYIRTAKAKGLKNRTILTKHALRNALIPIITTIGTQLGYLLGGAVLTETIFSWPGMGTYIVQAILNSDSRALQASVLIIAVGFITLNLLIDLSYAILDPRIKTQGLQ